jgi:hypothetical protein
VQNLTPEEIEQLEGMKKWERIRKERRVAAGIPVEGICNEIESLNSTN